MPFFIPAFHNPNLSKIIKQNGVRYLLLLFLCTAIPVSAQHLDSINDTKYLEDQFYIGLSYITLRNIPDNVFQNGFSNSLYLGFIKDIPLNLDRDVALGIGLGYGRNTYYQNIKITKIPEGQLFTVIDGSFRSNKFSIHAVEIPIELRWRTSTPSKFKFVRIYTGGKLSYPFAANTRLRTSDSNKKIRNLSKINPLQYGFTFSVGYGAWNANFYYGLSDIFKNAYLAEDSPIKLRDFRIGLIFYIL